MKLEKTFSFFQKNLKTFLLFYLAVQLAYLAFFPLKFQSDSLYYFKLAQDCLRLHTFYPAPMHLYEDYITAPLYVNILVVLLRIYNSEITIGLFNVVLNFTQLLLVYKITENIFGKECGKLSVIIYIFYLSTLGMILFNLTEFLFNVLILASVYFYLQKGKYSIFISGIFAAASVGVRPLGWALLAAYLVNFLFAGENIKFKLKEGGILIAGALLFISSFGLFTYSNFGRFIFTSTNGPVNLLIGANDDATGAYNDKVFREGNAGYIFQPETKTYIQKENFWFVKAAGWIAAHPIKYISLFPLKLIHIFIWDDFTVSRLLNFTDWNLYRVMKNIFVQKEAVPLLGDKPLILKFSYFFLLIIHHLYYFLIMILFLLTISKNIKKIFNTNSLRILFLFIIFGISIHLLTFGDARFKYPYIITMMIFIPSIIYQRIITPKAVLKQQYEL